MEKYNTVLNDNGEVVNYYSFNNEITRDDVPIILEVLNLSGIVVSTYRLSNSEEQPEHFFRVFNNVTDFAGVFWNDDIYIDDFGVSCKFNGIDFSLTFNFLENSLLTFSKKNINLDSLLVSIEQAIQKKTK